jgi:Rieske 2Fe-2S family protein
MLRLLEKRRPGFALERGLYVDPDYFRLDMEMIWYREWLFVGHDFELEKKGSYFTVQIGDYSVIVIKGEDNVIRALHNTCRHRGSKVCLHERGSRLRLVCPYHQWSYKSDGALLFARDMGNGFDKSQYGLMKIACETVEGAIYINLSTQPRDFAPVRDLLTPYIQNHALKEAKVAFESTIVERGNWKLVWENNRECYHCTANHPELCVTFPDAPSGTGQTGGEANAEVTDLWDRCEAAGVKSRYGVDPMGQFRAIRIPLLKGATSYTMSGKSAVSRILSDKRGVENIGALLFYHYPSTWNHFLEDHALSFRILPLSATETAVTTKWLVHKDAVEGVDYDLKDLTHVWVQTNERDRKVVEDNSAGILSPAYSPGPYSTIQEDGVEQFVEWYESFIKPRLRGDGVSQISRVA